MKRYWVGSVLPIASAPLVASLAYAIFEYAIGGMESHYTERCVTAIILSTLVTVLICIPIVSLLQRFGGLSEIRSLAALPLVLGSAVVLVLALTHTAIDHVTIGGVQVKRSGEWTDAGGFFLLATWIEVAVYVAIGCVTYALVKQKVNSDP